MRDGAQGTRRAAYLSLGKEMKGGSQSHRSNFVDRATAARALHDSPTPPRIEMRVVPITRPMFSKEAPFQ